MAWQCAWSLSPGSANPPPGVSLAANGTLSGTPTSGGTASFIARVTDGSGHTADQILSLTIANPPLQVMTSALPNGTVGTAYNAQLTASGGQQPYTWSLAPGSANPPPGVSLAANGTLSGTPISSGTVSFIARVTDGSGQTATQVLSLTVNAGAVELKLQIAQTTTGFRLEWASAAGQSYLVQSSSDLVTWAAIGLPLAGTGNTLSFESALPKQGLQFFRIRAQ